MPAEREDPARVPVVDDLERDGIAAADLIGKAIVAKCREKPPGAGEYSGSRAPEDGSLHGVILASRGRRPNARFNESLMLIV
jgi:hypothetical protein